jgi:hypothetical protein
VGYFLLALVLFMAWHTDSRGRVAAVLDSVWGWLLPFGIFWKWGRARSTLGDWWPLWLGAPVFVVFRAGQRWTEEHEDRWPAR